MSGSQLSLQNFTTLVQNSAAAAQGASSSALNLDPGSVIRAILEADAGQALWLQYLAVVVLALTRLATSYSSDCDTFGAQFGFTRLPAIAATGNVTFSRYTATQSAFIPVGTSVVTADGTQTFTVGTATTNANYVASPTPGYNVAIGVSSITVPVLASVAGTNGNVLANTISLVVSGIPGIDTVNNANATSGGQNAESDTAFKARFINFINSRSQGTAYAVNYAIQQLQQGLTDTIQENQTANGAYTPGTFVVTVDDGSGNPPASLLTAATTAVQAIRPIGSTAIVQGPTKILANISVILTVTTGANLQNIEGEVNAALTAYIESLPVGGTLPYSKLSQVIYNADPAISNANSILLNGGIADLVATPGQVIRIGTVSVT